MLAVPAPRRVEFDKEMLVGLIDKLIPVILGKDEHFALVDLGLLFGLQLAVQLVDIFFEVGDVVLINFRLQELFGAKLSRSLTCNCRCRWC